jgi:membrane protease YdiL (CAAX protease family)
MMQRLLRGWIIYWVLGLIVVILHARVSPSMHSDALMVSHETHAIETLEWWPAEIGAAEIARRPLTVVALGALSVVMLGVVCLGVWWTASGLWSGRLRSAWRFSKRRLPAWSFGELGRVTILIALVACFMPFVRLALLAFAPGWKLDHNLWLSASMLFLDLVLIWTILVFGASKSPVVWKALGLSSRRIGRAIRVGLRGYITLFPWLIVLLVLAIEVAHHFGFKPPVEPIQELMFQERRPLVLGFTMLLACVIGPIAEELFFRGVLYTAFRRRTSRLVAIVVSGALFALVHTNAIGFLPILTLGCLLAYLYERTGSLVSPLAVHVAHNTLLMSLAMVFRQLLT